MDMASKFWCWRPRFLLVLVVFVLASIVVILKKVQNRWGYDDPVALEVQNPVTDDAANQSQLVRMSSSEILERLEQSSSLSDIKKNIVIAREFKSQDAQLNVAISNALVRLEKCYFNEIESSVQKGHVEKVRDLLAMYNADKLVAHLFQDEFSTSLAKAVANRWRPYRQMLKDGSMDGVLNADWQKKVDAWRLSHWENREKLLPWDWRTETRNDDPNGKKYRACWLALFDEQQKPWRDIADEKYKSLQALEYQRVVTNMYFQYLVAQKSHLESALTNANIKVCRIEEWKPRRWTKMAQYGKVRNHIPTDWLWNISVTNLPPAAIPGKKKDIDTQYGFVQRQCMELENKKREAKALCDDAFRHYASVTNKIGQLKSASPVDLKNLIEGRKDDELMDALLELIVNQ